MSAKADRVGIGGPIGKKNKVIQHLVLPFIMRNRSPRPVRVTGLDADRTAGSRSCRKPYGLVAW